MTGILTADRLRELLNYDPDTGIFTWKIQRNGNSARAGSIAGCPNEVGYLRIKVDGRLYSAARLAVLYMTGNWPVSEVDHKNLDQTNNQWGNLREATRSQNCANKRLIKGITQRKSGKFVAQIKIAGRAYNLGSFATALEAKDAYDKAAKERFGEFARLR